MSFLTVRPSVHVKDVGDGRRFPGVLFFSLFRVLLQFLFFTVYIYCCVVLITVAGTAGGGDAAASALFFLSYILHHIDSLVRDILLCSCSCRRSTCDVES